MMIGRMSGSVRFLAHIHRPLMFRQRLTLRKDVQHNMFLLSFDNQLGTAPPNNKNVDFKAKRVLDVGTGTGIWAMEFGDEHPDSEVGAGFPEYCFIQRKFAG